MSVIAGKLVRVYAVVRMCRCGQRRKCQYNIRVQMIQIIVRKRWQGRMVIVASSKKPITKDMLERLGIDKGIHESFCSECGNIFRNDRVDQEIMVGIVEDRTS